MCDERTSAAFSELEDRIAQLEAKMAEAERQAIELAYETDLYLAERDAALRRYDELSAKYAACEDKRGEAIKRAEDLDATCAAYCNDLEAIERTLDKLDYPHHPEDCRSPITRRLQEMCGAYHNALALNAKLVEACKTACAAMSLRYAHDRDAEAGCLEVEKRYGGGMSVAYGELRAALDAAGKGVGK